MYIISKAPDRKSASHARAIGSVQKISRGNISNANANNRIRGNKKKEQRTRSSKQRRRYRAMQDVYIVSNQKRLQPNIPCTGDNKPRPKRPRKKKERKPSHHVISHHIASTSEMSSVNAHVAITTHQHHEVQHQHRPSNPKSPTSKSNAAYQKPTPGTADPQDQEAATEAHAQLSTAQRFPNPPKTPYSPCLYDAA